MQEGGRGSHDTLATRAFSPGIALFRCTIPCTAYYFCVTAKVQLLLASPPAMSELVPVIL